MSEHRASIHWLRNEGRFDSEGYSRDHEWAFDGGQRITGSAAPEYLGNVAGVDPEEALVAALSSCHMLTLLAIAAKKGWVVDDYQDEAVGTLEKNSDGRLAVTRVVLRPRIVFAAGKGPDAEALVKLHESAHRNCFIANSVRTEVTVEAQ